MGNAKKSNTLPFGIYRHYKGGLYRVHAIAYNEETLEPMVVYESMNDGDAFPQGTFWTRPLLRFTEMVTLESGEKVERFMYESSYERWLS
jgi:hypothetical protein